MNDKGDFCLQGAIYDSLEVSWPNSPVLGSLLACSNIQLNAPGFVLGHNTVQHST